MQIEKILIIESPVMLYRLMESRPEILDRIFGEDHISLMSFFDSVSMYLNGCKCDIEKNYDDMMARYSSIQIDSISGHIRSIMECDRVDFK